MLGLIFTSLNQMIEERHGLKVWNEIVRAADIPDCGAFTAGAVYPDEQMGRLVKVICEKFSLAEPEVLRAFGQHVFTSLAHAYPDVISHYTHPKDMLLHVDDHIHREIAFYHPNEAGLPTFSCEDTGPASLTMIYRSPRKLCFLAEGVIQGVADLFHCHIHTNHSRCVYRGDEHCCFELTIDHD